MPTSQVADATPEAEIVLVQEALIAQHEGPAGFGRMMDTVLEKSLTHAKRFGKSEAMLLVPAFNEWSEQAVLEPNDRHGIGYLVALRQSLRKQGQYHYTGRSDLWKQVPDGKGQAVNKAASHEMTQCYKQPEK